MTGVPLAVSRWVSDPASGQGAWKFTGHLSTWRTLELAPRHNGVGTWSLSMPYNAQAAKITPSDAVVIDFRQTRFTALIEHMETSLDEEGQPILNLAGTDALALLGDVVIWPEPTSPLDAQGTAHWEATGAAERVLRDVITAQMITRRDDPITVAGATSRGTNVTLNERFSNLLTVVTEKAEAGGLGVSLGIVSAEVATRGVMTLQFYEPADRSRRVRLSHQLGNLRSWTHTNDVPTATQAIVAGQGKGTARKFVQVTASNDAEDVWARKREVFVDARDEQDAAVLTERGNEALLDAASQEAFDLETADSPAMRYGETFWLGDTVAIDLLTGLSTTDVLRQVTITADESAGVLVRTTPGNPDVSPLFRRAAILRALRRRISLLEREEEVL